MGKSDVEYILTRQTSCQSFEVVPMKVHMFFHPQEFEVRKHILKCLMSSIVTGQSLTSFFVHL